MIKSHYIIVSAMMALLTACSGDEDVITPAYTVGEADNAITLRAGIREGGSGVQTRAVDTNHANHLAFTRGTMANLRIDGTWTGHGTDGTVTQTTSATIGAETSSGSKHDSLALTTDIFWDDYGTADPANTTGRTYGLTIYGVAVDGYKTGGAFALPNETNNNLTTISEWEALPWTLPTDQTSGWANYDLLTSNNVKPGNDGTLKFDEVKLNNNSASDLLVFTHAMSKITVNLKAGKGFPSTGVGNTSIKFASSPTVTLTSNTADATTKSEWPNTTGNVNVTTKVVGGQSGANKINMHINSTADATYTAIYDALVMPGSCFGTTDDDIIARIDADGNVYYVTAKKIRAKMQELNASTDYKTEAGKNYIINVTVNKTSIKVTATITDWVDVQSEEVSPVINVGADWGTTDSGSNNSFDRFSFYRSTSKLVDYSKDYSGNANGYFAPEGVAHKPAAATDQWPFMLGETVVNLYWPDHSTHYHFRGVWPTTSVATTDTETAPHVRKVSDTDATQKIDIKNVAYNQNKYPSDLLIGMPELSESNKMCQNSDHTAVDQSVNGICATEGKITLNFRYVMSQVEVVLSTSAAESSDHVNINENTKVEIVNVANEGYVKLGDRVVVPSTTKGTYKLDAVSGSGNELKRHSAIVPQDLPFSTAGASTNLRFKITVTNTDSSTDVYYADINPIKKTGSTDLVAPKGKWESGVHYIYNLKLTKTEIKVAATVTDWTTVDASDDIWM